MRIERLYLDLDGTLIDSSTGILRCIRYALDAMDIVAPGDRELHDWIGPPLRGSFAALVGENDADRAVNLYRQRYRDTGWLEFAVYPGIPEMLERLADRNIELALATSKPRVFAERIVDSASLAPMLSAIFGAELDGTRADKAALLAHAEEALGPKTAAMLGDRRYDVQGAHANGLLAIGAGWGFASGSELRVAGADIILHEPLDLPQRLNRQT
ncbi:MAG: HAD hydrolase-like protein [Pseudomonadota bacterium]